MRGRGGVFLSAKGRVRSCTLTGDRGRVLNRTMAFRQCDEMVYARFALHRCEPSFFKTTDSRSKELSDAECARPMALSKSVLGVWSEVQACGWQSKIFSQPLARVGESRR